MAKDQYVRMLCRAALLCAVATLLLALVLLDTPCLFRRWTGIPCPTCGISRAWLAAFRLDPATAFYYHPMFWSVPVLAMVYILDGCPFPGKTASKALYLLILIGFGVNYLVTLLLI
jgi:hypothetical protein